MSGKLQEGYIIYVSHGATLQDSSLESGKFYFIENITRITDTMYQIIVKSTNKNDQSSSQILYDSTLKLYLLCDINDRFMINTKLITLEVVPKEIPKNSYGNVINDI